jgi:hypothetical protein
MSEVPSAEKWLQNLRGLSLANIIFSYMAGKKYNIAFNTSKSTAVAITQTGEKKNSPFYTLLRLDRPHKGANYNHININHRISGKRDPHLRLPTGALLVSLFTFIS